jgi:hypothetical protein
MELKNPPFDTPLKSTSATLMEVTVTKFVEFTVNVPLGGRAAVML